MGHSSVIRCKVMFDSCLLPSAGIVSFVAVPVQSGDGADGCRSAGRINARKTELEQLTLANQRQGWRQVHYASRVLNEKCSLLNCTHIEVGGKEEESGVGKQFSVLTTNGLTAERCQCRFYINDASLNAPV